MLALTRRVGEEIVIGDPRNPLGTIRIVDIHGDKVRLSFDFPRDTQINRKELADEKAKQLLAAADASAPQTAPAQTPSNAQPAAQPAVVKPRTKPPVDQ
jgi:carbon storage regulator